MRTSPQGLTSILADEAVILSTYVDDAGVLTIGAGHTRAAGAPDPVRGLKIDLVEAFNIFRRDIQKYEEQVSAAVDVPLKQNQFDALVSWHFNTGAINKATLTEKLNAGDFAGAAREFARWNKSDGRVLRGLVERRKRETAIFNSAHYGDRPIVVRETKTSSATQYTPEQLIKMLAGSPREVVNEEDQTTEELLANPNSRLLPSHRPRQSDELTRATLAKFAHLIPVDRRDDSVGMLAVRGYYSNTLGRAGENDRNLYDDAIFVIEPDDVHNFNGNTDPSKFRRGIAMLKAPQAVRYKPGPHGFNRRNGPYPAFRQDSNVTVVRDRTGEDTDDAGHRFWINLHRGTNTTTSSAGCQTVPPHQWNEFKVLVDNLLDKYGQENFYYVLVEQDDVPSEVAMAETSKAAGDAGQGAEASNIAEILAHIQAISDLLNKGAGPQTETGQTGSQTPSAAQVLIGILHQLAATAGGQSAKPATPLTPVNAALGETIGKALNGRKTGIGILGLLATSILPMFFPELVPIAAAVKGVAAAGGDLIQQVPIHDQATWGGSIVEVAKPIFAALTGWGVLGKLDKWFGRVPQR